MKYAAILSVALSVACTTEKQKPATNDATETKDATVATTSAIAATKDATATTKAANTAVQRRLDFANRRDFEDARRGFIAPLLHDGVTKDAKGNVVSDARPFALPENAPAPETVNPSLWRQTILTGTAGLFKVIDGIYQVRGIDLSNITFIEGEKGVIVMDPLMSAETAKAALDLYVKHRPGRPVVAVIYTHSHVDHFGGVRGVVDEKDVRAGKVAIIAPAGFTEEAVSENVFAGNAMMRRATYSYGFILPNGPQGNVGNGLGTRGSSGSVTLIPPTITVSRTGQKLTVDGLEMEFMMAPNTEAPAEMHFYIPKYKALTTAENACHTLHNFYTLRGAKTRDIAAWVRYLNQTLDMWGNQAEVLFMPHTWPVWSNARINEHIEKYRDTFRYIHDQALHLANQGYTMDEIGEMVRLPDALEKNWASRGYYGSVSHNARAVYNFYLGYFDGNPADLHRLMPVERAQRYVKAMGGANNVIALAREAFNDGDYRWTAELLKHVVYADPSNTEAKYLQADAFEQLGYQAENATWRGFYLSGAQELRTGVKKSQQIDPSSPDVLHTMPVSMLLDFMAIKLNGPRAAKTQIGMNLDVPDAKERYGVTVKNGVLNYRATPVAKPDVSITLPKSQLTALVGDVAKLDQLSKAGKVKVSGDARKFDEMLALMDPFDFWFNIVTPIQPQ